MRKKRMVLCAAAVCVLGAWGCGKSTVSTETIHGADRGESFFGSVDTVTSEAGQKEVMELPMTAEYSCEKGRISLQLPEAGLYKVKKYKGPKSEFGIRFRMDEKMDGWVKVVYKKSFGVCGTGLEEIQVSVNEMPARMGIYDNEPYWFFIALLDEYGGYVIQAENADVWWEDYGEQVMQVLDTLTIERKL